MQWSQRPELACADLGAAAPEVIAGQVDVLPAERRQVFQQAVIDRLTVADLLRGLLEREFPPENTP